MATNPPTKTPEQTDLEYSEVDQASRYVREYQGGKLTLARVRQALQRVKPEELQLVAIATRAPLRDLQMLRGSN